MNADLAEIYRQSRQRLSLIAAAADPDVRVPATPDWSVHDVMAHLAGVAEDVLTGNVRGAPSDPWTRAQVERGRNRTVADLIAQWEEQAPTLEGLLAGPGGERVSRSAFDVLCHEADVCAALAHPVGIPADVMAYVGRAFLATFARAVAAAGLPEVTVAASDWEVFRSRPGRRTRAEARALAWSRDPEPYLDLWFFFGPAQTSLYETSP
jgi:uncharacterized protein (TIGR03083 family)